MKKILPHIVFLYFIKSISAQEPEIQWEISLGGSQYDEAYSTIQTTDSGYITCGDTWSNDGDVTEYIGISDIWVTKLDPDGNLVWQKTFGGTGWDEARQIIQTNDLGFLIIGYSSSNDGDVTLNHGLEDFWVLKTDYEGNLQWERSYGGSGSEKAFSVIQTYDDDFVIAGVSTSLDGDVTENNGGTDIWVIKINDAGDIIWQNSFGGSSDDNARSIRNTPDNNYIITGFTESFDGDITGNHGVSDYLILKLDVDGTLLWQKCYGGTQFDYANSACSSVDNCYFILGYTTSSDGDISGFHGGYSDYWLIKLDSNGALLWQKCYGGAATDEAFDITYISENSIILTGYSGSNNDDVDGHHGGALYADYWVANIDSIGGIIWQKSLGGNSTDEAFSSVQTIDTGIIITGWAFSTDGDVTGHHGALLNRDWWIVKVAQPCSQITYYADLDEDGYGNIELDSLSCYTIPGFVSDSTDCNDTNNLIFPTATDICNALDDNCNGLIDEDAVFNTWFADMDDDGFGDVLNDSVSCSDLIGFVTDSTDCNDSDPLIHPLMEESCNGIDDNCNLSIDEGLTTQTLFADADDDGFGNPLIDTVTCFTSLTGFVSDSTDCNDTNPLIYPGAPEILNNLDDNCNQLIDEGLGISDNNYTAFTIFPNPVTSNITIQFASPISHPEIKIFNSTGQLVYEQHIPQTANQFTISGIELPAGSYFLRVVTEGAVEMGKFEVVRE